MGYKEQYMQWLESDYMDEATKEELRQIAGDEKEIEERFYTELEFGTAGLRGIIGAGCNRMNEYTVRKATQGLANYILKVGGSGSRRSDRLRFQTYVTGIRRCSSTLLSSKRH